MNTAVTICKGILIVFLAASAIAAQPGQEVQDLKRGKTYKVVSVVPGTGGTKDALAVDQDNLVAHLVLDRESILSSATFLGQLVQPPKDFACNSEIRQEQPVIQISSISRVGEKWKMWAVLSANLASPFPGGDAGPGVLSFQMTIIKETNRQCAKPKVIGTYRGVSEFVVDDFNDDGLTYIFVKYIDEGKGDSSWGDLWRVTQKGEIQSIPLSLLEAPLIGDGTININLYNHRIHRASLETEITVGLPAQRVKTIRRTYTWDPSAQKYKLNATVSLATTQMH